MWVEHYDEIGDVCHVDEHGEGRLNISCGGDHETVGVQEVYEDEWR